MISEFKIKTINNKHIIIYYLDKFILQNDSIICILFYKTNLANENLTNKPQYYIIITQ